MTVRELIEQLLDYDMDQEIEIRIETNSDTEEVGFEIDSSIYKRDMYFVANLEDYELVEKKRFEELEDAEVELQELMNQ